MIKTVRRNENKLRVTQGALERSGSLPTRLCALVEKFFTLPALRRPLWRGIFSLFYMRSANPFTRSIYIYQRQGSSSVIVLFKNQGLFASVSEKLTAVNRS